MNLHMVMVESEDNGDWFWILHVASHRPHPRIVYISVRSYTTAALINVAVEGERRKGEHR